MQQPTVSADVTLHPSKKAKDGHANTPDNYFAHKATGTSLPEIATLDIPDVATGVRSTYLLLHEKRHIYAEEENFHIVKNALSELRGYVNKQRLHKMTIYPPKTPKTIRQYFRERIFRLFSFDESKSPDEMTGAQEGKAARYHVYHSHTWRNVLH